MVRNLLLGCAGSIGVLFLPTLIIRLRKEYNTEIDVMMTANAQKFLTPYSFEILTGKPVTTDMFVGYGREHITLVESHDVFLIAPATASMISKIAAGIADDIVSLSACVCMGSNTKLLVAPAMNAAMWSNPFVQANVEKLKGAGVHFVGPSVGTEIVKFKEATTALASDDEIVEKLLEL
uniref:Phosphopantothenoylcysteine decarboxylase n=1 Tax=Pseudomonas sp. K-62 TaxID=76885 RepID=I2FFZ7_9PSED|nr:flavoprotein [Pseudomonas sp. K-62]BAM13932.1 phosphopantothenoylcysteine decarboxylase [Pseudomonas sp. K-62]